MKKKLGFTLLTLILALSCAFGMVACGEKHEHKYGVAGVCTCGEKQPPSKEVQYSLSDDGTYAYVKAWKAETDIWHDPNLYNVMIAEEYENKPVTEIRGLHVDIQSVIIPKSVISIADNAFSNCSRLRRVTFSEGLKSIGKKAFFSCWSGSETGLTSLVLPDSLTSIGDSAFGDCFNLESAVLPCTIQEIGDNVFSRCSKLNLYFKGSENDVTNIAGYGKLLLNAKQSYFYSITAPSGDGNYWHYDTDNVTPVVW